MKSVHIKDLNTEIHVTFLDYYENFRQFLKKFYIFMMQYSIY